MYYFFNRFRIVVLIMGGPLLNLIPTLPVGHQEAQRLEVKAEAAELQISGDSDNSDNC
jgi:hypothetical protein